tara:strand:- start:809 stop:2542 length:1734 start_codon:yes stop_codon:yes gene_type:complete
MFNMLTINLIKYIFVLQIFYIGYAITAEHQKSNPEGSSGIKEKTHISFSEEHMIVCADKRAALAAKSILQIGGNALDAAIAAQNVLSVVEPQSSGIGGGGFLLFLDGQNNQLYALDGREYAPKSATKNIFIDKNGKKMPFLKAVSSGLSVGVPGLYSMLADAHKMHGVLSWNLLFKDAIKLANGFKISERLNYMLNWAPHLGNDDYVQSIYFKNGKAKDIGQKVINKKLSLTLKEISKNPYTVNQGKIAEKISNKLAGNISIKDLSSWKTIKRKPLCKKYFEYNICGFPPPTSGGIGVLQILGILEKFKNESINPLSYTYEHLFLEASRLAYNDRDFFIADPDFFDVPTDNLLLESYIIKRAKEIDINKVNLEVKPGNIKQLKALRLKKSQSFETSSTTHISIVDKYGNAVSLTSSIEFAFGTGMTVGGFFLNNQLTDFSFSSKTKSGETIANSVGPMKKPRSSMAPTILFRNNSLKGIVGSPGGSRIICYVSKTIYYLIKEKNLKDVLTMPHFCSRNKNTEIEKDMNTSNLEKELSSRGHNIVKKKMTSGLNVIWKKNGLWQGGSDPRREGVAVGF